MRIFVIGEPRSGKSTVAGMIAKRLGTFSTDTSELIVEVEAARLEVKHGADFQTRDSLWDRDRDRPHREDLIATGDALKQISPTVLVDYCFSRGDVCAGVRKRVELKASLAKYPDSVVILVKRDGTTRDSFDIDSSDLRNTDYLLWNTEEGLDKLSDSVDALVEHMKGQHTWQISG